MMLGLKFFWLFFKKKKDGNMQVTSANVRFGINLHISRFLVFLRPSKIKLKTCKKVKHGVYCWAKASTLLSNTTEHLRVNVFVNSCVYKVIVVDYFNTPDRDLLELNLLCWQTFLNTKHTKTCFVPNYDLKHQILNCKTFQYACKLKINQNNYFLNYYHCYYVGKELKPRF